MWTWDKECLETVVIRGLATILVGMGDYCGSVYGLNLYSGPWKVQGIWVKMSAAVDFHYQMREARRAK